MLNTFIYLRVVDDLRKWLALYGAHTHELMISPKQHEFTIHTTCPIDEQFARFGSHAYAKRYCECHYTEKK